MNACEKYDVSILRCLENELSGRELEDFSVHLKTCANCRARLEQEQALSRLLHRSRPLYSAPALLRACVSSTLSQLPDRSHAADQIYDRIFRFLWRPAQDPAQRLFPGGASVPAILAIALCLVFIPNVVRQVHAASYVAAAVAAHRSSLHNNLAPQIRSDSPQVLTAWFAGKLPFRFQLPSAQLDPASKPLYRLTGASLLTYEGSHIALVTYETQKEKISLLVASSQSAVVAGGDEVRLGNLTFHYRSNEGFKVITWVNHGLSYALVSSISASARESCMVCHENMADRSAFAPRR
jgi:anti-sigma factor RsiW